MTSPYLERPCRPLEEAKRQVGPRNWGVPPQVTVAIDPAKEPPSIVVFEGNRQLNPQKDYRLGIAVTVAVSCAGWFAIFALAWAIVHLYAIL